MSSPRRSLRGPTRAHTPLMSERKKSLFGSGCGERAGGSGGGRRALPALHSESESDCEGLSLGIAALDSSSSGDERDCSAPSTPAHTWRETRSHTRRLLKDSQDMKDFIKSPYTLRNYRTRLQNQHSGFASLSTPATPRVHHPGTPSSTHSTASAGAVSSERSRARKSLASLIADTESCSSSLKDLNFDTDSGTDTKENTPKKNVRKSNRKKTMTPKFASFKGILEEQKQNNMSPTMDFTTDIDKRAMMSPTVLHKTPHNTSEVTMSPPKISHNRRAIVEIGESPDENDRPHKRHWNSSIDSETGPNPKNAKLDGNTCAPKARLSLFSNDKLMEILSTKSFYPKANVSHEDISPTIATKVTKVIASANTHHKRSFSHSYHRRRNRKPGQINSGVRHRIRKPKLSTHSQIIRLNIPKPAALMSRSTIESNCSFSSQDTSATCTNHNNTSDALLYEREKGDPFAKEHRTIDSLLSQWTEEEIPYTEPALNQSLEEAHAKIRSAESLLCFNRSVIEESSVLLNHNVAIPVSSCDISQDGDILEIGSKESVSMNRSDKAQTDGSLLKLTVAQVHVNGDGPVVADQNVREVGTTEDVTMADGTMSHKAVNGQPPKGGQFLPVEGGYLLVAENEPEEGREEVTDLDAIERELAELDEQLCRVAERNNIDPAAILTASPLPSGVAEEVQPNSAIETVGSSRMFPIFHKDTAVPSAPAVPKGSTKSQRKLILKSGRDQYVIDAGQKCFGATQCKECGVIYQIGDPQDEHDHMLHHNAVDVLRFNGWKEEIVTGVWGESRCLMVRGSNAHWRRVDALLERVVHPQLGYAGPLPRTDLRYSHTAYLYINKKQIVGCLIVETKEKVHRLLSGDVDCCSVEEYPVKCGVSRLWTHVSWRRRSVASSMLNCARATFIYGHVLAADEIAFSAPTLAGRAFAAAYTGRPDFYVYVD